jgi:hypothetical protein
MQRLVYYPSLVLCIDRLEYSKEQYTGQRSEYVLTKTQLRTAKTKELEKLQARIAKELESRREKAYKEQSLRQDYEQRFYSGHKGSYRWEWVQCGHAKRCPKCQSGERHGPYLYRYFYKNGRQRSEYIRKSDYAKHPDAPPKPN